MQKMDIFYLFHTTMSFSRSSLSKHEVNLYSQNILHDHCINNNSKYMHLLRLLWQPKYHTVILAINNRYLVSKTNNPLSGNYFYLHLIRLYKKKHYTTKRFLLFWHWLPWKPDIKISWRPAKTCPLENWRFSGWLLRRKLFYIHVLLLLLKELFKHFLINWEQTTYSIRFVLLSKVSVTVEPNFINYQTWPFLKHIISKQQRCIWTNNF